MNGMREDVRRELIILAVIVMVAMIGMFLVGLAIGWTVAKSLVVTALLCLCVATLVILALPEASETRTLVLQTDPTAKFVKVCQRREGDQ